MMDKLDILDHIKGDLLARIKEADAELASLQTSQRSDTKSSAGDKHETSRAMAQLEIERQLERIAGARALLDLADKVVLDRACDKIGFGNLVTTSTGLYFVALAFGRVVLQGKTCYCISLQSPIGTALKGLSKGEGFEFQGRTVLVEHIA